MTIPLGRLGSVNMFTKLDHVGHGLIFVKPHVEQMTTQFGETEAALCEHIICATCQVGWADEVVFGSYLVPRICSGDPIVPGILVQGKAQPGRNAPWLLDDPGDDDREVMQALADRVITRLGSGKLAVDLDLLTGTVRHQAPESDPDGEPF
jgi:hypothetical protein